MNKLKIIYLSDVKITFVAIIRFSNVLICVK